MAKNPNELGKILNEMTAALQELSDAQLESVQSILSNQKDLIEKEKKVKKAKAKLEKEKSSADKKKAKDSKSIIDKTLEAKEKILETFDKESYELAQRVGKTKATIKSLADRLGSGLVDGLGLRSTFDAYKSVKSALSNPKEFLKDRIFGTEDKSKISSVLTIKKDLVLSQSNINNLNIGLKGDLKLNGTTINQGLTKTSQSLLNFDAEKNDIPTQQLETLKTIDNKLDHLGVTGQSGGMFDFLANGLKDVLTSTAMATAQGVGGAAATTGLMATLSKYGKNIPGISKIGKAIEVVKAAPKTKIGLGALAVGALGYGANEMFNSEETPVEPRLNGGLVEKNKPYVVGEGGKELFVPNSNGVIVPNNKSFNLSKEEISKLKLSQNNRASFFVDNVKSALDSYNKPFTTSLTKYFNNYNEDYITYKEDIKTSISSIFGVLGSTWDKVTTTVGSAFQSIKDKTKEIFGFGDKKEEPKTTSTSSAPSIPQLSKGTDAPEVKLSGGMPSPQQTTTSSATPSMLLRTESKLPKINEGQSFYSDYSLLSEKFSQGVKDGVKFEPKYEPSNRSNIVANTWGL